MEGATLKQTPFVRAPCAHSRVCPGAHEGSSCSQKCLFNAQVHDFLLSNTRLQQQLTSLWLSPALVGGVFFMGPHHPLSAFTNLEQLLAVLVLSQPVRSLPYLNQIAVSNLTLKAASSVALHHLEQLRAVPVMSNPCAFS